MGFWVIATFLLVLLFTGAFVIFQRMCTEAYERELLWSGFPSSLVSLIDFD